MKIVVLDGYTENPGDLSWDWLDEFGTAVVYDRTAEGRIEERIAGCEIVFTNKTPLTALTIEKADRLKFIGVLATGFNVVDVNAARAKGIVVCNVPSYGTDSVSQFAIALLLELCHHIGHHDAAVHSRRWEHNLDWCFWDFPLVELAGKTMGIIGFGRIGHRTGQIARALGMKVVVNDRFENPDFVSEGFEYADRSKLLETSDVIMLHCPLFPDTEKLINAETIARMKDGVMIVNNSRGQLIDELALADALKQNKVAGAAVDVVSSEPIKADNPLLAAPNCIITPHMSWAPKESRQRIMDISRSNLSSFLEGNPQNVVNR